MKSNSRKLQQSQLSPLLRHSDELFARSETLTQLADKLESSTFDYIKHFLGL